MTNSERDAVGLDELAGLESSTLVGDSTEEEEGTESYLDSVRHNKPIRPRFWRTPSARAKYAVELELWERKMNELQGNKSM